MPVGGKREGAGRKPGVPNKATADVQGAARIYTAAAIKTLAEIMADKKQPSAARVAAADKLLDRAHGKPKQAMEHSVDESLADLIAASLKSGAPE